MLQFYRQLFLSDRFFWLFGLLIFCFVLGFPIPPMFNVAKGLTAVFLAVIFLDIFLLYSRKIELECLRIVPKILSLGDENKVRILLENWSTLDLRVKIIDELPVQFQNRDFEESFRLRPSEEKEISYELRPIKRGEYAFGGTHLFLSTALGIVERRITKNKEPFSNPYPN